MTEKSAAGFECEGDWQGGKDVVRLDRCLPVAPAQPVCGGMETAVADRFSPRLPLSTRTSSFRESIQSFQMCGLPRN